MATSIDPTKCRRGDVIILMTMHGTKVIIRFVQQASTTPDKELRGVHITVGRHGARPQMVQDFRFSPDAEHRLSAQRILLGSRPTISANGKLWKLPKITEAKLNGMAIERVKQPDRKPAQVC